MMKTLVMVIVTANGDDDDSDGGASAVTGLHVWCMVARLRLSERSNPQSTGTAAQILQLSII